MYDIEDEVDWSDSSLTAPHATSNEACVSSSYQQNDDEGCAESNVESESAYSTLDPREIPSNSAYNHGEAMSYEADADLQQTMPSAQALFDSVLHQANQRIYEVTFFKTFLAHALDISLSNFEVGHTSAAMDVLTTYLHMVRQACDQVSDKMVRNTHASLIPFFAACGSQNQRFLDVEVLKQSLLSNIDFDQVSSVAEQLMESWELAPGLLGTPQQIPIDLLHAFEEQVTKPLQPFESALLDPQPLEEAGLAPLFPIVDDADELAAKPTAVSEQQAEKQVTSLPQSSESVIQVASSQAADAAHHISTVGDDVELDTEPTPVAKQLLEPASPSSLAGTTRTVFEKPRLDDTHSQHFLQTKHSQDVRWKLKLLDDHLQRLTGSQSRTGCPPKALPQDLNSVISRAIDRGVLRGPGKRLQMLIDAASSRQNNELLPSATSKGVLGVKCSSVAAVDKVFSKRHSVQRKIVSGEPMRVSHNNRYLTSEVARRKAFGKRKRSNSPVLSRKDNVFDSAKHKKTIIHNDNSVRNTRKVEDAAASTRISPLPPHPSGSKTIEPGQVLPPTAFFHATDAMSKPAWRCGIKHALGHYYNAGDRRNCPGCNTNIQDSPLETMDFFLPSRTHFRQPAPSVTWRPYRNKLDKPRKTAQVCHNGIARDLYWEYVAAGSSNDEALQQALAGLEERLKPKPKPKRKPKPDLPPKSIPPPVDLGPHPSGSRGMEHGQDIPESAYYDKRHRHEEFAWRCDSGHALGRYYLAGDRRSCPGCGSNRSGPARKQILDFYLPSGGVICQEASGIVTWRPRKPYKTKAGATKEKQLVTHNQVATRYYWEAIDNSQAHDHAMAIAVAKTNQFVDDKYSARDVAVHEARHASPTRDLAKEDEDHATSPRASPEEGEDYTPSLRAPTVDASATLDAMRMTPVASASVPRNDATAISAAPLHGGSTVAKLDNDWPESPLFYTDEDDVRPAVDPMQRPSYWFGEDGEPEEPSAVHGIGHVAVSAVQTVLYSSSDSSSSSDSD